MTQEKGIPYQRHRPSAALRAFLEPLDSGPYFDCGRARLHGLDDALVREAKSRGREPGEDSFELVATETGLVFCRESISFAISAPWERITVGRPRGDDPVELAVIWPVHGELVFTVSRRLAGNVLRRWVQRRARAASRVGPPTAPTRPSRAASAPTSLSSVASAALRASDGVIIGAEDGSGTAARAAATTRRPAPAARDEREAAEAQPVDTQPIDRLPIEEVLGRLSSPDGAAGTAAAERVEPVKPQPVGVFEPVKRAEPVGVFAERANGDRREDAPVPPPIRPDSASRRPDRTADRAAVSGVASGALQPDRADQRIAADRSSGRSRPRVGGPASLFAAMLAASVIVFAIVISVSAYRAGRFGSGVGTGEVASADLEDGDERADTDPVTGAPSATTIGHRRFGDGDDTIPDSLPLADEAERPDEIPTGPRAAPAPERRPEVESTAPIPTGPIRCNSNYSGCVPDVEDVDCPGGEGPVFAPEPGVVMGEDVYGLDTDGDGRTCEDDQPV